jgi:hypothetical protein
MDADVLDAVRLLRFGLQPRLAPGKDAEYLRLARSWDSRPELQRACEEIAEGLGLWVLTVDPQVGMVCCAEPDSPFELRIGDFLRQARAEGEWAQRVVFAVALLATWRLCFPRPAHLDEADRLARVSVNEVIAYVDGLCDRLDEAVDAFEDDVDPPVDRPDLERAWRAWQRRGRAARTRDGRRSSRTTSAIVARALAWMADQGLMDKVGDDDGGTYRSRPRLRVLVQEVAGAAVYEEVVRLVGDRPGAEEVRS